MKTMIVAIVAMFSMAAFAKSEYKTELVCGLGEAGNQCAYVTYKVRPAKPYKGPVEQCSDATTPCEPKAWGVPGWLQKLNEAAHEAGATTRDPEEDANKPY